jgi:hypothetical protein
MLRTITLGTSISIQGIFVRALEDGRIMIQVDDKSFVGMPVQKAA